MSNDKNKETSPKILEIDPYLVPFKKDIKLRIEKYTATKNNLVGLNGKFKDYANGHLYFGFHKTEEGWYYREWAPSADALYLIGDFNHWNPTSHPLEKKEHGCWEIFIPGKDTIKNESFVKVRVKSKDTVRDRIPLYIRRTFQDPITHDFKGQVWQPELPYPWTDMDYKSDNSRPLFIYECHIGMAQEEEVIGSFKEFTQKILPKIKANGYNTIQLMAIMDHPYYGSFGYHVSNFFAVSSWFGTPEDLKELVNTAHSMNINVLMDLVHSHAVKNTSEGINEFDGTEYQFFHEGDRGNHIAWDSKLFNYEKPEVIHFLLSNLKYWMDEYHFDGFRFDGITSMIYKNHGLGESFDNYKKYFSLNTDTSAITYLQFTNELIKEINPYAVTIAEDMSGMPGMCLPIEYGGIGFDYRLAMGVPDFWVNNLCKGTDESLDIWKLWWELTTRRPNEKTIGYAESHDQALVGDKTIIFWLADKEMYWHMTKEYDNHIIIRAIALHKMIRFITLTLAGEGYLNFMGNEFGHPEWIDFPREGNDWSHHYARRQWSLADNPFLRYTDLYKFDKDMLAFVKEFNVLEAKDLQSLWIDNDYKLIAYKKADLVFLFNFNPTNSFPHYELPTGEAGNYKVVFNSDEKDFGGYSRIPQDVLYSSQKLSERNDKDGIIIYSPSRTVLVLKKID